MPRWTALLGLPDLRHWCKAALMAFGQTQAEPAVVKQGIQHFLQAQKFPDHGVHLVKCFNAFKGNCAV